MIERSATTQEAELIKLGIKQCLMEAEGQFLNIGLLLKVARDERHWQLLNQESFRIYIDELELPWKYKHCLRLIEIVEYIVPLPFATEDAMKYLGVSKLIRLLPAAKKGELREEDWEFSKIHTDLLVRDYVGHNVDNFVNCPNCGTSFIPPKRKEKHE